MRTSWSTIRSLFLMGCIFIVCACSVNKYIPEDKQLYTGADIRISSETKIHKKASLHEELESILYPEPNTTLLGMRPGLLFHYKSQKDKPGFINKFLNKKFGEEPVYLSDVDVDKTTQLIDNRLENNGFFRNQVSFLINTKQKHTRLKYEAEVSTPYVLKNYELDSGTLAVYQDISRAKQKSPIKPGDRFNLQEMKNERDRIDEFLKSIGYYNFNGDFLIFEADTNQHEDRSFDLFLRLKKNVPAEAIKPYRIESIEIFPDYSLKSDTTQLDTVIVEDIEVIQSDILFKPKLLPYYLLMKEDTRYNPTASKVTSKRFSSTGTYKYVNIRHEEAELDASDSVGLLHTKIFLSPMNKRSLRAELQAVAKSNNFAGPTILGTYTNRNLFKGGELLQISGNVGFETQLTGGKNSSLSNTQFGISTDLIFPRLIPIHLVEKFKYDVPKTIISLGINYLKRSQLYTLRTLSANYGYTWNASRYIFHEFNPININLVNLVNTSSEFKQILTNNPFLASSFDQEFIGGMTYSFTYTQMNKQSIKNPIYLNSNLDIAGNVLNAISNKTNDQNNETFLNMEYAQYAKADIDIRFHFDLGKENKIVTRAFAGYGIAYGNTNTLPFAKQYYAGGPYSVRAFQIRSLGPGIYAPGPNDNSTTSFFDRTGDIRLEANAEYRFPIYSVLKGAVFLDAGNVWLRQPNKELTGGEFTSDFYKQLGIGTGAGIRVDIQNFVIRGDFAFPLDKPNDSFSIYIKDLLFNFAIGYPF